MNASLFGRDPEITRFAAHAARLRTLHGPVGVGKTRLVDALTAPLRRLFVEVVVRGTETSRNGNDLLSSCCHALGISVSNRQSENERIEQIGWLFAQRSFQVVVLDGVDGVLDALREALPIWTERNEHTQFVLTSRRATLLPGEVLIAVEPWTGKREEEGLQFLREKSGLDASAWREKDENEAARQIVRELDGIPLFLELAARKCALFGVVELAGRLHRNAEVLEIHDQANQNNSLMRAAWIATNDLDPLLKESLVLLQVLPGAFSLREAEALLGDRAAMVLDALHDRSLLRVESSRNRFWILQSIAQAHRKAQLHREELQKKTPRKEKLQSGQGTIDSLEREAIERCLRFLASEPWNDDSRNADFHSSGESLDVKPFDNAKALRSEKVSERLNFLDRWIPWVISLASRMSLDLSWEEMRLEWLSRPEVLGRTHSISTMIDRVKILDGLLQSAQGKPQLPSPYLAFALDRAQLARTVGENEVARRWIEIVQRESAAMPEDQAADWWVRAQIELSNVVYMEGDISRIEETWRAAEGPMNRVRNPQTRALFLEAKALSLHFYAPVEIADDLLQQALHIHRQRGDFYNAGRVANRLAFAALDLGNLAAARERLLLAQSLNEGGEYRRLLATTHLYWGNLLRVEDEYVQALEHYAIALELYASEGDRPFHLVCLMDIGIAHLLAGDCLEAVRWFERASIPIPSSEGFLRYKICSYYSIALWWLGEEQNALEQMHRARSLQPFAGKIDQRLLEVAERILQTPRGQSPSCEDFVPNGHHERVGLKLLQSNRGTPRILRLMADQKPRLDEEDLPIQPGTAAYRILLLLTKVSRASAEDLVATGWPGEKLQPKIAKNRLRVTVFQLRKAGLRSYLLEGQGNYRLSENLVVRQEP